MEGAERNRLRHTTEHIEGSDGKGVRCACYRGVICEDGGWATVTQAKGMSGEVATPRGGRRRPPMASGGAAGLGGGAGDKHLPSGKSLQAKEAQKQVDVPYRSTFASTPVCNGLLGATIMPSGWASNGAIPILGRFTVPQIQMPGDSRRII